MRAEVVVVDVTGKGSRISYSFLACDRCGQVTLVRGLKVSRPCRMTPGCKGRHRPFEGPFHRALAVLAETFGSVR